MKNENPLSETPERRQRVQSAEMGMSVLKALARLDGMASLTAIAAEVGESTAKVHRYMASLGHCRHSFRFLSKYCLRKSEWRMDHLLIWLQ